MLENSLSILHNAKFTSLITFYPLLPLFLLSKWLPLLPFFVSSYQRIENRKKHPYLFLILCKRNNCIQLLLLSCISRVRLYATPETAAHQAPPSLGFSRREHWSGLPFPSPMQGKWKVKVKSLSRVWLLATPWTAAYQALPSTGFSRQEYWSGVPLPSPLHNLI